MREGGGKVEVRGKGHVNVDGGEMVRAGRVLVVSSLVCNKTSNKHNRSLHMHTHTNTITSPHAGHKHTDTSCACARGVHTQCAEYMLHVVGMEPTMCVQRQQPCLGVAVDEPPPKHHLRGERTDNTVNDIITALLYLLPYNYGAKSEKREIPRQKLNF